MDQETTITPAPPRMTSVGQRAGLLFTILLFLIFCLSYFVQKDPLLFRSIRSLLPSKSFTRIIQPQDYSHLTKDDPPLGWSLPSGTVGLTLRKVAGKSQKGYLVVWVGDCAGCISANLSAWEKDAVRLGVPMIILTSAKGKAVRKFKDDEHLMSTVVSDPTSSLSKVLNSTWFGRPYLFSSDWRLQWLERRFPGAFNPFDEPQVVNALNVNVGVR